MAAALLDARAATAAPRPCRATRLPDGAIIAVVPRSRHLRDVGRRAAPLRRLRFTPVSHPDPLDTPRSPLDLRFVSFGQQDTSAAAAHPHVRRLAAARPRRAGPRRLCVTITPAARRGGGDLCVVRSATGATPAARRFTAAAWSRDRQEGTLRRPRMPERARRLAHRG